MTKRQIQIDLARKLNAVLDGDPHVRVMGCGERGKVVWYVDLAYRVNTEISCQFSPVEAGEKWRAKFRRACKSLGIKETYVNLEFKPYVVCILHMEKQS